MKITLILLIFVFLFSGSLKAEAEADFNLPLPEQSQLVDTKEIKFGDKLVQTSLYTNPQQQFAVIEFYKKAFAEQGFRKILDKFEQRRNKRLLRFKKGNEVVSVAIMPKAGATEMVIARYLQPLGSHEPEKTSVSLKDLFGLPEKDVEGEDLKTIPRPPQGIRWIASGDKKRKTLMYATPLSVEAAAEFYRKEMLALSWKPDQEVALSDAVQAYQQATRKKSLDLPTPYAGMEDLNEVVKNSYSLEFHGDDGSARIIIFPNFMGKELGSIVSIIYQEKKKEGER